jgi:hypothetical protein
MVDCGSVGNLTGDEPAKTTATAASKGGKKARMSKRDKPLNVSGVGNGSQKCEIDVIMPLALPTTDGKAIAVEYKAPVIPQSKVPMLLGLAALRRLNAIIDFGHLEIHLPGPGHEGRLHEQLLSALPPGSKSIECKIAPSGHLVIPCDRYSDIDRSGGVQQEHVTALPTSTASSGVFQDVEMNALEQEVLQNYIDDMTSGGSQRTLLQHIERFVTEENAAHRSVPAQENPAASSNAP